MNKFATFEESAEALPNILEDLRKERTRLGGDFPVCALLINEAFDRFYSTGVVPGSEIYIDILNQKPIKLSQKVLLPRKILAPEPSFLSNLQDEAQCQIRIKERNYITDQSKEEELLKCNPKFNHLTKKLFLEINAFSTPIECYSRIADVLAQIRKYMISHEDGLHEELHELEFEPEKVDYPENIKPQQLENIEDMEDPLQDFDLNEPIPLSSASDKLPETEKKLPFTSLANKLIKLLRETIINNKFQYTEEVTSLLSSNIDILNSFVASKSLAKSIPFSLDTDVDDIPISIATSSKFSTKSCSQSRDQNAGAQKMLGAKRKKIQDLSNTRYNIKEKQISNKRRKIPNTLRNKKENCPGIFYLKDKKSNKIIKHRILNKSALYRCLKRCKTDSVEPEENENYKLFTMEFLQQTPSELVFECTPRDIIISFLESMKNYPVLWEFHDKPFNEDYKKATENICNIINVNWSLNIDSLKLRRSINRVLRFYRYLFPFECIDKFTEYFDKCATFLPTAVIRIPHARCSHCFICYEEDFELKKHLLEEHKTLKWRYKCEYCAESFKDIDEYELHNRLPHYVEVFTCEHCNKRFSNRFSYSRHSSSHQQKNNNQGPRNYICDECGKAFKTSGELRGHKFYHGEKKIKCHLCSKSYFKNTSLMLHLKRHRKELDFICEVCGDGFLSQAYLKNHMEKHIGLQVSCKICGLKLRKHNLFRHLRTVHVACEGTIEETFRAKGHNYKRVNQIYKRTFNSCPNRSERSKENHQRQYECKTCNIPFDRLKYLKDHNKQCHSNVDKIPCKMCDSKLSHKQNLKRHYREKHKLHEYQVYSIIEEDMDINAVLEMKSEFLEKFNNDAKNVIRFKTKDI